MRQTKSLSPPTVYALVGESSQVVASPCWDMALPDVISAILVWVLGPPTPWRPFGAYARYFPKDGGLTSRMRIASVGQGT